MGDDEQTSASNAADEPKSAGVVSRAASRPEIPQPLALGQRSIRLLLLTGTGLIGGFAAVLLIDHFDGVVQIPAELAAKAPQVFGGNREVARQLAEAEASAYYWNLLIILGLSGAAVGGVIGVGEAVARRSLRTLALAAGAGVGLGAIFGSLGGLAAALLGSWLLETYGFNPAHQSFQVMGLHALIWVPIGAAVGMATSLPGLQWAAIGRMMLVTSSAGLIAAILYVPLGAVITLFVEIGNPDVIVPEGSPALLLWSMLASGLIGCAVGLYGPEERRPDRRSSQDVNPGSMLDGEQRDLSELSGGSFS